MEYNLFDIGFDKFISRDTSFVSIADSELPVSSYTESVFEETNPSTVGSGESSNNIDMVAGFNQSANFVTGVSGWRFDADGNLEAQSGTFRGTVTATAGAIGGFVIGATVIRDTDSILILNSSNQTITVGASEPIIIDGANKKIYSSNYVTGPDGTGFYLDSDLLEVGNVAIRGLIRTAVFQKDVISTVGGSFMVIKSDVLEEDMTALESALLVTKGDSDYAVDDILRIKDGDDDEWMTIDAIYVAVDSYDNSATDYSPIYTGSTNKLGQSFLGDGRYLSSCIFKLCKYNSPTGLASAVVYLATGTSGTNAKPTGSVLATSDTVQVSTLTSFNDFQPHTFTFSGVNNIELVSGTAYVVVVQMDDSGSSDSNNVLMVERDGSSPTASGNHSYYYSPYGTWYTSSTTDLTFYVYGYTPNGYVMNRDSGGDYTSGENPTWKKGATIVNYGQTGDGGVYMTASDTNAPYLSIFDHEGAPWTTINTRLRIGNLNGYLGYTTDTYGIAIGNTDAYLKYDSDNGLRLKSENSQIDVGTTGYVAGGQTAFKTGSGFYQGYDTTEELEQYYYVTTSVADYLFADSAHTADMVGQGFSVTDGQTNISTVKVYLKMKTGGETSEPIICSIHLLGSDFLPTGGRIGEVSIAGISNTDYVEKTFTFSTPVTVSSSNNYAILLESDGNFNDGIYVKYHASPNGDYLSGQMFKYEVNGDTYTALGGATDMAFEIFSKYDGYKWSVGTTTNMLSFNTKFLNSTKDFIVRSTSYSDAFAKYEDNAITFVHNGQSTFKITQRGSITSKLSKGLSVGTKTFYEMTKNGGMTNDVFLTTAGWKLSIQDGISSIKFTGAGFELLNSQIGTSTNKATIYCGGLSACPLPVVDNALSVLDTMIEPKEKEKLTHPEKADFEYASKSKKRKYFDDITFPDELTFINDVGEKDIELIRTIGFCVGALKELNDEVKKLKQILIDKG